MYFKIKNKTSYFVDLLSFFYSFLEVSMQITSKTIYLINQCRLIKPLVHKADYLEMPI